MSYVQMFGQPFTFWLWVSDLWVFNVLGGVHIGSYLITENTWPEQVKKKWKKKQIFHWDFKLLFIV